MAPTPLPPEQIKTSEGIGINEREDESEGAKMYRRVVEAKRCIAEQEGPFKPTQRQAEAVAARVSARIARERPRTVRRFVTRGGELVEIESVVRETR